MGSPLIVTTPFSPFAFLSLFKPLGKSGEGGSHVYTHLFFKNIYILYIIEIYISFFKALKNYNIS